MGIRLLATELEFDCGARVFSLRPYFFHGTVLGAFVKKDRSGFTYVCLTEDGNTIFVDEENLKPAKELNVLCRSQ